MRPVRFAVVGTKGVGQDHLKAIGGIAEVELVAVCDVDAEAARVSGEECGVAWFQDYHELLKMDGLEVVDIATPHYLHAPMAIEALEAGIHVVVEKPMAMAVSEADEMVAAARSAGRLLGVCQNYRCAPEMVVAKRLIEEGILGRVTNAVWSAPRVRTQAYYDSGKWRGTWEREGGGVVINQGIHDLDALRYLLGEPSRVLGSIQRLCHDIEVEDVVNAIVEFKSGASAAYQATTVNAAGCCHAELYGDKAALVLGEEIRLGKSEVCGSEFIRTDPRAESWAAPKVTWETLERGEEEDSHAVIIGDFARAVREGREPMVNGEDGRGTLELVNAVIMSGVTGRAVGLPLDRQEYDRLLGDLKAGKIRL